MFISELTKDKPEGVYDLLMADFASGLAYGNSMQKAIDRLYTKNKYVYYQKAKASPAYNSYAINMSDIVQTLYTRRALGILLCAEEDEQLANELVNILRRHYPLIYKAAKRTNPEIIRKVESITKNSGVTHHKADITILYYLILKCHTPGTINEYQRDILQSHLDWLADLNERSFQFMDTRIVSYEGDELDQIKKRIEIDLGFLRGYEDAWHSSNEVIKNECGVLGYLFFHEQIDPSKLLSDLYLTDEQVHETILPLILQYKNRDYDPEFYRSTYFYLVIIKSLLIRYKESRDFFFKNNEETQFLEMYNLEQQITSLKNKLKESDKESSSFKDFYLNLKKDFDVLQEQNTTKVRKEYSSDLATAQAEVKALNIELEKEKSYRQELNQLRSLLFNMEYEELPQTTNKSLADYSDKNIFVIDGATEWRLRMSQRYDNVHCLDGTNENVDLNLIKGADFIFFFSKHMNHATYYGVIDFIRINKIPFGYISRTNTELAEAEMISRIDNSSI